MAHGSKLSPDDALALILAGLKGEAPLTDICRRYGVTQTTYRKLRDQFLKAGAEGLQQGGKLAAVSELDGRIRAMERTLERKTLEVEALKKKAEIIHSRSKS